MKNILLKAIKLLKFIWIFGFLSFAFILFDSVILGNITKPFCTIEPMFFSTYMECPDWVYKVRPSMIYGKFVCELKNGYKWDIGAYGIGCLPPFPNTPESYENMIKAKDPKLVDKLNNILINILETPRSFIFFLYSFLSALALYLLSIIHIIKTRDKVLWFFVVFLVIPYGAIYYYFKKVKKENHS